MSINCLFNVPYLDKVWSEGAKVYQYPLGSEDHLHKNLAIKSPNQLIVDKTFICCTFENSAWSRSLKKLIWKMYKVYANHLKISSPLTPNVILTDLDDIFSYQLKDYSQDVGQIVKDLSQKPFEENVAAYLKQASKLQSLIKKQVLEKVKNEGSLAVDKDYLFRLPFFMIEIRLIKLFSHVFEYYLAQQRNEEALKVLKRLSYTKMGADCSLNFLITTLKNKQTIFTLRCLKALNRVAYQHRETLDTLENFLKGQGKEFREELLLLLPQLGKGVIQALITKNFQKLAVN